MGHFGASLEAELAGVKGRNSQETEMRQKAILDEWLDDDGSNRASREQEALELSRPAAPSKRQRR